jgi:hypothetical protein
MEMYVSAGFMMEDRDRREAVVEALDLFYMSSAQEYSGLPDKIKEFESRLSALLGDTEIFEDGDYYAYLQGLEDLRVNAAGSVSLRLTTGALGDEFARSLRALLKRLGAKHIRIRVKSDEGEEWTIGSSTSSPVLDKRTAKAGDVIRHLEEAVRSLDGWLRRRTGPINGEPAGLAALTKLAEHLVQCAKSGATTELPAFFTKFETLYQQASPDLREWLTIGLLLAIYDYCSLQGLERTEFDKWLGSGARAEWDALVHQWEGGMKGKKRPKRKKAQQ